MIELRLLGPVVLSDANGRELRGLLAQPRRLALLVYLAAATPRGLHRRDSLAALFWPELDQAHARAALRQAIYVLRTTLGTDTIVSRGDEDVGLAFDRIACDVVTFDDAAAAGRFEEALELFRGNLLEGFFISSAPDFERWLEEERGRLHASATHATVEMIKQAEGADDFTSATRWTRQAVRLTPHDEAGVRRLMSRLASTGDRTGAVSAYRDLAKRLTEVFEVAPSPETEALLAQIRAPQSPAPRTDSNTRGDVAGARRNVKAAHRTSILRRSDGWRPLPMAALVAMLVLGMTSSVRQSDVPSLHAATPHAVVVLPMNVASDDAALGMTADGLVEALTTDLARIKEISVIARRASLTIPPRASVQTIVRLLRVSDIVGSSVRRAGDQLSIDVALIDGSSGVQRWSRRFEGDARNFMALENRIVRGLITALDVPLTASERQMVQAPGTNSPEAYNSFVLGKLHFRHESRSEDSIAIMMFERAVRLDPSFAAAHALLGRAYGLRYLQFAPEDSAAAERASLAIDDALRLDPDLPEAHYARGMILWGPRNHFAFEFAAREYRRAIELNPNLDDAHHQLGVLYLHAGLLDKAVAELEKTLALDPGNRFAEHRIGVALIDQGRYEEGLRALRAVPSSFNPALWYYHVAWALLYLGRNDEASALVDEYLLKHPEDRGGVVTSIRAISRAKRGDVEGAERDIATAEALGVGYVHFHHTEYNIASAYALLRRSHDAVHWLERAADDGWPCYPYFARDPNLDNIRADPAFIAFLTSLRGQWERYRAVL